MAPMRSLVELCLEACQRNISQLTSFGDADFLLPPEYVHDLLFRINDPVQLRTIEINSPHLQSETASAWKRLIRKEFPVESRAKNYTPKNPTKWFKIWERYSMDRAQSQQEAEEKLRASFQGLQAKKDSRVSKLVDSKLLPRPPKTGRNLGTQPKTARSSASSTLSFGGGSRTKMNSGANVLKRARREAAEFAHMRRGVLARPVGSTPSGSVKKAPAGMVNEKRIAAQPSFRPRSSLMRPTGVASSSFAGRRTDTDSPGMEGASRPPNYVSDSSDDDEDGDGIHDLFGDDESSAGSEAIVRSAEASAPLPKQVTTRSGAPGSSGPKDLKASSRSSTNSSKPLRRPGLLSNAPKSKSKATHAGPNQPEVRQPSGAPKPQATETFSSKPIARPNASVGALSPPSKGAQKSPILESAGAPPSPSSVQPSPQAPLIKKRKAAGIFMPQKKRR